MCEKCAGCTKIVCEKREPQSDKVVVSAESVTDKSVEQVPSPDHEQWGGSMSRHTTRVRSGIINRRK